MKFKKESSLELTASLSSVPPTIVCLLLDLNTVNTAVVDFRCVEFECAIFNLLLFQIALKMQINNIFHTFCYTDM